MIRRSSALAISSPSDALLDHLAPIGLAASAGTALVVDTRLDRPGYGAELTIGDLVRDGLRRVDLAPTRPGVAVLGAADVPDDEVYRLVCDLAEGWPAVVLRTVATTAPFPSVVVRPLHGIWPVSDGPAVYQRLGRLGPATKDVDGLVLPPLRRGQVSAMLAGRIERRWRWVRAWSEVWECPWV